MPKLIVALDNEDAFDLAEDISEELPDVWFKIGPQLLCDPNWNDIMRWGLPDFNIFLDIKLIDTKDTVTEAVKRFADAGISAVSTIGHRVTETAVTAAINTPLKIWQLLRLSDNDEDNPSPICAFADGVICPANCLRYAERYKGRDIIVPGVRFTEESANNHLSIITPTALSQMSFVTHAVVGRPIYNSDDPLTTVKKFHTALGN